MNFGRWLRDRPRALERLYDLADWMFIRLTPVLKRFDSSRLETLIKLPEKWSKQLIFDCRMCGQCVLHSTGMTCPMTCPKNLRNGPCGGVRSNGHCEVKPEMPCVWVEAFERSLKMSPLRKTEMKIIQPPVNRQLEGQSAWITILTGESQQISEGWE